MNALPSASPRLEYLDALRGFAILGVISAHCAGQAGGAFHGCWLAFAGSTGVLLFFLVSAFTIFLTLDRAQARETHVLRNFFIRRFMRILPMFWVGSVLYVWLPGREHCVPPIDVNAWHYALTAALQHGWHPATINSVVPGGWTIAVEGAFYLIAPWLFFKIRDWRRALWFLLAALFFSKAATIGLHVLVARAGLFGGVPAPWVDFFYGRWFPTQLPVFACGILAFRIIKSSGPFWTPRIGLVFLAASGVMLFSAIEIGSHGLLSEQVFYGFGYLLLILGLNANPLPLFVNFFTRLVGRISYSAYILHFVILEVVVSVARAVSPGIFNRPLAAFILLFFATALLTIPVAWTTFRFVETPAIALGARWIRRNEAAGRPAAS